jgi:hypothetical protein
MFLKNLSSVSGLKQIKRAVTNNSQVNECNGLPGRKPPHFDKPACVPNIQNGLQRLRHVDWANRPWDGFESCRAFKVPGSDALSSSRPSRPESSFCRWTFIIYRGVILGGCRLEEDIQCIVPTRHDSSHHGACQIRVRAMPVVLRSNCMHISISHGYRTHTNLRTVVVSRRGLVTCKTPAMLKRAALLVLRRMMSLDILSLATIRCPIWSQLLVLRGDFTIIIIGSR